MLKENNPVKKALAAAFVLFLFIMFIKSGSYFGVDFIFNYLKQDPSAPDAVDLETLETNFGSALWKKNDLIDLNGLMMKKLGIRGFYSYLDIYITKDNYLFSAAEQTSTDYEYEELVSFRDFLESNGIQLLFVSEPTKYTDDSSFSNEFGLESYINRNTDRLMERIRTAGINAIDLRDNIRDENINVKDLFYRTDHHWTAPAGLWAVKIIARGLNDLCGYDIDTSIYDIENFEETKWEKCWLGEQGRMVAETYVGLDDYVSLRPEYETDYTFKSAGGSTYEGTFDSMINYEIYNTEKNVYENPSWHYSYMRINSINNKVDKGKVLLLGDSYACVTQPFLSLGIHELDSLTLRDFDDTFSLRDFILRNGYDTVIVAYGQPIIGAHDDPTSANYRMFTFDF